MITKGITTEGKRGKQVEGRGLPGKVRRLDKDRLEQRNKGEEEMAVEEAAFRIHREKTQFPGNNFQELHLRVSIDEQWRASGVFLGRWGDQSQKSWLPTYCPLDSLYPLNSREI